MDTRARGDIAEAAVLHAMARCGLSVWLPWSRFGACDLIFENNQRARVKFARDYRLEDWAARFAAGAGSAAAH